ncbi:MAG: hypothetical protein A4E45_00034 [Methanosaeta sp. PtaB.Bin039]|nr:MAG: hypothetical protein A4E45_00034 [Methanosaeta sp. PtaB.Bin039]OPY47256.1 MAG: hypothetical protein A4E47_00335 [Methanosaeta sp. PtaU1.Bin028]HOT08033.1 Lrp/AsnC family transcriptional regulator [Methanotrichaceae archaeon]HQF15586.1 Lrp/AsnC family transcriptional regulator [Methanotrichaceae archaeon]HQI90322.1 Lrp/AsnC family transcriptional regulator [Methanotrichaceae archaeon]
MDLKLTTKERLVLYGLSRYPGLSDIDLATKIGVDRSTIFKSKRKFRDWQLIKLLNVPAGKVVGAEILTVVVSRFQPTAEVDLHKGNPLSGWVDQPSCVFHSQTSTEAVSILYSRSLTDQRKRMQKFMEDYQDRGLLEETQAFYFPLEMTRYASESCLAVNDIFELNREDLPQDMTSFYLPDEESRLTEKDKMTLYAFIRHPMLSDLELSRRTGISRPTISGKRTKFFQSGLLYREAFIDWQKICCELLTFYRIRFISSRNEVASKAISSIRGMGAPLFSYVQPGETFGAFLSSSYLDLKQRMDASMRSLASQGLVKGRPELVIMPLEEIGATKMDYAPMVAEMLDIGREI